MAHMQVITMILEYLFYQQHHDWQVTASVAVMMAGALIAAVTDLSFDLFGYTSLILNDILTAFYLILVKHLEIAKHLDSVTMLSYNALISILPLVATSVASGEMQRALVFPMPWSATFLITAAISVFMGLAISHSTFVCTRHNDPLTTSVAGNFKSVLMTGVGMIAFGDYIFEKWNMVGIAVSMAGMCWYSYHRATSQPVPT